MTIEPETAPDVTNNAVPDDGTVDSKSGDILPQAAPLSEDVSGPRLEENVNIKTADLCYIVARNALGQLQEFPISAEGLQNTLETTPVFVFPVPPGQNLKAVKCLRNTLTPGANDYKVARAGYSFVYQVEGDNKRRAALEFMGGKFRMNLVEGDFTPQELIDAKARILSFNDQHLKDVQKSLEALEKGGK